MKWTVKEPGGADHERALKSGQARPRQAVAQPYALLLRRRLKEGVPALPPTLENTALYSVWWLSHVFEFWASDGSRWPDRSAKKGPSWSNMAPRWPNMGQAGPKGVNLAQHGAKMAQDGPQARRTWGPRWATLASRWTNIESRWENLTPSGTDKRHAGPT